MNIVVRLWRESKGLLAFLLLVTVFRSAIADWNVVPSGSMLPTIEPGDRILVDKLAYDLRIPLTHISVVHLGDPQRGDNRDDSADSRYFGFFPRREIMGRVRRVAFALDPAQIWRARFERFGKRLDASTE